MGKLRILLADDNFLIREGIKNVLQHIHLCAEVSGLNEIPAKIQEHVPDILLFEILLCKKDAKKILKQIKLDFPFVKILIISDCTCDLPMLQLIRFGIDGFIRKNIAKEELLKAVNIIAEGGNYYADDVKLLLANPEILLLPNPKDFSEREIEVLHFLCKGRNNEQISDILYISENTVATHKRSIMQKAKVKKASELIIWAFKNGMVEQ